MSMPPTDGPTDGPSDGTAEMESLYPFLYADSSDLSAVLEQVRASTAAKAEEILQLRRVICERDGARLTECAYHAAGRFHTRATRTRNAPGYPPPARVNNTPDAGRRPCSAGSPSAAGSFAAR